jgi:hypothetical protein
MRLAARQLLELLPAALRMRDQARAEITPGLLDPEDRGVLADLSAKDVAQLPLAEVERQHLEQLRQQSLAGPLASLLAVIAEQVAVLQEDLDQLYDDQFIETCAPWVMPYIGDLVGSRPLHGVTSRIASPRAVVAHTIAYRRRKGTALVLEQLARDVTGWNASAVEFFQRLVTTQYMNHLRRQCRASPDLRQWEPLHRIGTAFDSIPRTIDVRRIASQRGRHNVPNVGIFLWRLDAYPLSRSPAVQVDAQRWRFHPLNIDQPLYTRPQAEDEVMQRATPLNVPEPIGRRVLDARLTDYYTGVDNVIKSLRLYEVSAGTAAPVPPGAICICNLADDGAGWAHQPAQGKTYAIDPELGRIASSSPLQAGTKLEVDFHYGFSADLGGGEYERAASFASAQAPPRLLSVPADFATIGAALAALGGAGVVEITDSGRYEETLAINVTAGQRVELRAANGQRPTLVLGGVLTLAGGADSEIRLNGLLIAGQQLRVPAGAGNALGRLRLSHCTLVPGLLLAPDCTPQSPQQPSLIAELAGLVIVIERTIVGGLRVDVGASVSASESIIDATATTRVAHAALDGSGPGAALSLDACTVIGKVHASKLPLVTNSILLASLASADPWAAPVLAARRQEGCVRFSYVPDAARVPRRHQCLPESPDSPEMAQPRFTSLRYGFSVYAQLAMAAGAQLLTGADDQGQPGAFHSLYQPQREINLHTRLDEYLRAGLEAGIFYDS